ncbi:MAG: transglutaminase domain-containing protein [Melioribacteraceae bacterium]|nr:transglutaminase domain-containing protein [Melioribacteraceae bacterium]
MKQMKIYLSILFIVIMVYPFGAFSAANFQQQGSNSIQSDKIFYAIEINGVLCGYSEASETPVKKKGEELIRSDINIFTMLSVLGSQFNQELKISTLIEPETRKYREAKTLIDQGTAKYNIEFSIDKDTAYYFSSIYNQRKKIKLNPETITGQDEMFLVMKKDFVDNKKSEATYEILEMIEGEIQSSTFKKLGEEKIELSRNVFNTILLEQTNNKTNVKTRYWLAPGYDYFVKFEVQNRKVYLTDRSVVDKIKVSNMDANFFTKSNVSISDFQSISYLKIKGRIEPTGVQISSETLNIPGQRFDGTVTGNVIEGVFEISHKKYDGLKAPEFPPAYNNQTYLEKYLHSDPFMESNDPILVAKAKEITDGSKDSWEAAKRLSRWVAENISYAIPGGGTAKKTFEIRAGECGAHSMLLAAFCRGVGIPARVVFGAMYVPNFNGGFGQHAWNEVYMGDAGWIPIDATAHEIDYVDSGHLRISEITTVTSISFNGKSLEILEYKLGSGDPKLSKIDSHDFTQYVGKYTNLESARTFSVLVKENSLSVDIPGQATLPFNPPGEKDKWQCKIAPQLSISFTRDPGGKIIEMKLYQLFSLAKRTPDENSYEKIPAEFIPYMGKYFFSAINADLTVLVNEGLLAIYDPVNKATINLKRLDKEGEFIDDSNRNRFFFEKEAGGNVAGIKLETENKFKRGELAAAVIERIIDGANLQKGISKYEELKSGDISEIIFSERALNNLGYKYLNAGKFEEALEILLLNTREYPDSFNVYDSLGEAYMKCGRNEEAIESYMRSLALNPQNENAKKMIESLKAKL